MNFLLFYLFVVVTVVAVFITILNVTITFKARLKWVAIFSLPLILYAWDYPLVVYQIQRDCQKEGGLKVLKSLEKTHRLKLDEESYIRYGHGTSQGLLAFFYPALQEVIYREGDGKDKGKYFSIKVIKSSNSSKEKDWYFSKTEIPASPYDIYILKKESSYDEKWHRGKQTWSLSKKGQRYVLITTLSQSWPKIRYPARGTPSWTCRNFDKDFDFRNPDYDLTNLITK